MLTHKQAWRRVNSYSRTSKYEEEGPPFMPSTRGQYSKWNVTPRRRVTSLPERRRVITFAPAVNVIQIATRQEQECKELYWTSKDYCTFKNEAVQEIREYSRTYGISSKTSMQRLYQPRHSPPPEKTPEAPIACLPLRDKQVSLAASVRISTQCNSPKRHVGNGLTFITGIRTDAELRRSMSPTVKT